MSEGKYSPPKFALRFLGWFCPISLYEGIEGDLLEQFEEDAKLVGEKKAKRRFVWNAIKFFRPEILWKNRFSNTLINTIMLTNYFKVASRNILKRKLYSFINAFGLSVAIAFCTLIFLFIQDEKSFDSFHVNRNQIFRIEAKSYDTWKVVSEDPYNRSAWVQAALAPVLKEELPEVELATRYNPDNSGIVTYGDKVFTEKITFVDADFFSMFSFEILGGSTSKIFQNKTEVAITPGIAQKYFGTDDPIGKTISIDCEGKKSYTIAATISAAPANSSIHFTILLPQENRPYYDRAVKQWGSYNTPTFVKLVDGTNPKSFSTNLESIIDKYMKDKLEKWRKESAVPIPPDVKMLTYEFTALPEWHLKNEIGWEKVSNPKYSLILGGIALLILLIACINYVSLSLTTSASRRTEVGIRKSVGAQRNQLIYQFGLESLVLAFCSMIIGLVMVILFLPTFNQFTTKAIQINWTNGALVFGVAWVVTVLIGLLAGSYPSMFLSRFNPALVLKGKFTSKFQAGFTKPLVVLQFALSAFLIVSSVIMFKQMQFITTKDLGYDKEQILVVPTQTGWNEEANKTVERFRAKSQGETSIRSVTGTSTSFNQGYSRYGYRIKDEQKSAYVFAIDPYYLSTLNIPLMDGRNFDMTIASDTASVIVNEALVRDMKWTDPLNEHLNWSEDSLGLGSKVIGVVKDYHFLSLENDIEPMFLSMDKKNIGYLTTMIIRLHKENIPASLAKVKSIWKEISPDKPFDYTFLDADVARQYESHQQWMSIMGVATGFAILISCLGLFGLSGINAVNRTKEIGIRKVMGASLANIFMLLSKQYVWLSLIAFVIGMPFSWYVMNKWLVDFKFKIALSWELFAISVMAGLGIALLTVAYHAIKASLGNLAETLKYE